MPFLYNRLTSAEFFEFTGDLYGVPRDRTAAELEKSFRMFGLVEHRNSLIKDLSHGLK
jgi:ABC-type multidrug transport system ATPase subunit